MCSPILAIETATTTKDSPASVALRIGEGLHFCSLETPNSQAAQLVSVIEAILRAQHIWYDDLGQIVVTVGPGGFTGIRIGLAVARSIAFACPEVKLVALTTLEAMATHYYGSAQSIRTVLRAGKGEVFHQLFSRKANQWHAASDIGLCKPEAVPSGAPRIGNGMDGLTTQIDARSILTALDTVAIATLAATPLYIRPPDAKPPSAI